MNASRAPARSAYNMDAVVPRRASSCLGHVTGPSLGRARREPREAPTEGALTPPPVDPLPLLNTRPFVRQRVRLLSLSLS
jgi:hypothetical protein